MPYQRKAVKKMAGHEIRMRAEEGDKECMTEWERRKKNRRGAVPWAGDKD